MPDSFELSERELEILRLVATGAGNKEIAQRLSISANTVKVHLRNIFGKIGAASRTEAAMYAVRLGMVESGAVHLAESGDRAMTDEEDRLPIEPGPQAEPQIVEPIPLQSFAPPKRGLPWGWIMAATGGLLLLVILSLVWLLPQWTSQLAAAASPTPASQWHRLAPMLQPRAELAVAVVEGRIYAIGGQTSQGVSDLVDVYDPQSNQWSSLPPKPTPVMEIAAGVLGGKIYIPGGRLSSGETTHALEVYDPRLERWEQRASLPVALSAYAACTFEGRLYVFGGWDGKRFVNNVYIYDPSVDRWTEHIPMPTPRGYAVASVAGSKIYVMGGYDGEKILGVNEVFQPALDDREQPWASAAPMPTGRYAMGGAGASDLIYLVGGITNATQIPVVAYQPSSNVWIEQEPSSARLRSGLGVVAFENFLFAIGGQDTQGLTAANDAYQVSFIIVIPLIR